MKRRNIPGKHCNAGFRPGMGQYIPDRMFWARDEEDNGEDSLTVYTRSRPRRATPRNFCAMSRRRCAAARSVLQYRAKKIAPNLKANQAQALQALCKQYRVPLIINDDANLAASMSASGVHLGSQDMPIGEAHQSLLSGMLVGVSCYNQLQLAIAAEKNGADYVAFGSFFPSTTKPNAVRPSLDLLREAKRKIACPIVAIGGITLHNAPELIDAGADAVAVISALFDA